MDIDPRLAGPPVGSKAPLFINRVAGGVGSAGVASLSPTPPAHTPHPLTPLQTQGVGGGSNGGRPLGVSPASHRTPIQSAPPVFVTPSPTPQNLAGSAALLDQKRPRACESCRGLKVRCEPNEQNPFATCKRCAKANRECIFTAPSRKRQKKSDSKVAELEKKIDALTASLNATRAQQARVAHGMEDDDDEEYLDDGDTPRSSDAPRPEALDYSPTARSAKRRRSEDTFAEGRAQGDSVLTMYPFLVPKGNKIPTTSYLRPTDGDAHMYVYIDVVDRQLLSMEMATAIFNHYIEDMLPHFPAIVFPQGTTAEDIRKKKPTLFLAILAAASGTSRPSLQKALSKEIAQTLSERIMINGEKSLELVQSLILCTIWYYVPDHYEELKFYLYIHMAAVMALDIGITKKKKIARGSLRGLPPMPTQKRSSISTGSRNNVEGAKGDAQRRGSVQNGPGGSSQDEDKHPPPHPIPPVPAMLKVPFPDSEAIESRRTLLACYWTCCNVSMALRRPNLLRFTKFMDECVEVLESSPEAEPTDKTLCQWVKLQKIAEEVGIGFAFDDYNANVSIDDARVQFTLKGFARQLEEWKSKCPKEVWQESLELAYHLIMIYAHEIALHRDHNVDDFQLPYSESMMREPSVKPNELLSSCHLDAISRCLSSAHKLLETFMRMTITAVRSVPVFAFVRASYACVILIKLYFSASHPQSELGKVIDKNSLKVDEHMDGLLDILKRAGDGEASRQANKFTMVLGMLRHWYSKQKAEIEKGFMEHTPEPQFKRLEIAENNNDGGLNANKGSNVASSSGGYAPMEGVGVGTPGSIDDLSSANTPEADNMQDSMRPPPPRSTSLSAATPLQMLSNAALESSHRPRQQYSNTPSPSPHMGMATPRSAPPGAPPYGKWTPESHGVYPISQGDGHGIPIMGDGVYLGHGAGGGGYGGETGEVYGGGGHGMSGETMDFTPQYMFTGNGEMFMNDTFWAMMDGPMNMFDFGGGKY